MRRQQSIAAVALFALALSIPSAASATDGTFQRGYPKSLWPTTADVARGTQVTSNVLQEVLRELYRAGDGTYQDGCEGDGFLCVAGDGFDVNVSAGRCYYNYESGANEITSAFRVVQIGEDEAATSWASNPGAGTYYVHVAYGETIAGGIETPTPTVTVSASGSLAGALTVCSIDVAGSEPSAATYTIADSRWVFPGVSAPAQTITVAMGGAQYTSVKAGLVASGMVATTSHPMVVLVSPGIYAEDCSLAVPDFVTLRGVGGHESTIIVCNSPGAHGLVLGSDSDVVGIQVEGASGSGFAGFYLPSGTSRSHVIDGRVKDCDIGWLSESAGNGNTLTACGIFEGTSTSGVKVGASTFLRVVDFYIGPSATVTHGFHADGAAAQIFMQSGMVVSPGVTNGIYALNGGEVRTAGTGLAMMDTGMRVGPNGTIMLVGGGVIQSITNDAVMEASTSSLFVNGWLRTDKVAGQELGGDCNLAVLGDVPGDPGLIVTREIHGGTKYAGAEAVFGGGDSYFDIMEARTNTNLEAGAWVDVTTEARTPSGSTFTALPGLDANNCLYVGSPLTFGGLKVSVDTAMVLGAGDAVGLEYWSGASWDIVRHMTTDADAPYDQYADAIVQQTGSRQIRFDASNTTGWTLKTLDGSNLYWVRLCVTAGPITTAPVLEGVKCHTDRFEINADGFTEWFGASRPPLSIPFGLADLYVVQGFTTKSHNLEWSANLEQVVTRNSFEDNSFDATSGSITIPEGMDTSSPIVVDLGIMPLCTGGDIELEFIASALRPGEPLDGSAAELSIKEVQAAGTAFVPQTFSFVLDPSTLLVGDTFSGGLFRDARVSNGVDTLSCAVVLTAVKLTATKWSR